MTGKLTAVIFGMGTVLMSAMTTRAADTARDYPIQPVPFTAVHLTDDFWARRIEINRTVTIPVAFHQDEITSRVQNFVIAARQLHGDYKNGRPASDEYKGERYNDTDVYKVLEGAAYSLAAHPDMKLEKYCDNLIDIIAAAQEPDGYLFTARTADPAHPAPGTGDERWSMLAISHELYDMGHMMEAAVAYYQTTNKRKFLDVAIKCADLIDKTFGPEPDKRHGYPGHPEMEIALVKLYRVSGNERYLKLAQYFIDARGAIDGFVKQYPEGTRWAIYNDPVQILAQKPLLEQDEAVGHAVRAAYVYSGMADVAALTGDQKYITAIDRLWDNVVGKKLYINGGIGANHDREAFGPDYDLPNLSAYNETCASIGNVLWNQRLFLLHGDAKYIDVLERTAYNALVDGVSLSGDRFFYPNPLSSDGKYKFNQGSTERAAWFGVACCPGNVTRFLPSFPGYVYAHKDDTLYVNLFVAGEGKVAVGDSSVVVKQETKYPYDGNVKITLMPDKEGEFTIAARVPGWALNWSIVPSTLYVPLGSLDAEGRPVAGFPPPIPATLKVNGARAALDIYDGFARVKRIWKRGDTLEMDIPMPIVRVIADPRVETDRGRVALVRGPLVYCAEGIDNGGRALNLMLPDDAKLTAEWRGDLLGGVEVIKGRAQALQADGTLKEQDFMAIPYFAWNNRGAGEMQVWLARNREALNHIEHPAREIVD